MLWVGERCRSIQGGIWHFKVPNQSKKPHRLARLQLLFAGRMPGVFLSEKEDFVSFEYCDDFDLKTQLFKPKDITHNGFGLGEGGDFHHKC